MTSKKICRVDTIIDNDNNEIIGTVFYGDYPSVKNGMRDLEDLSKDEIDAAIDFVKKATRCYIHVYHCSYPFLQDRFPDETTYSYLQ